MRNPMCIGGFFMLAGLALLHRSPSMLVFALVVLYGVHLFIVWFEEPGLVKRFGDSYVAYRDSVNRWVPKLPSGSLRVK